MNVSGASKKVLAAVLLFGVLSCLPACQIATATAADAPPPRASVLRHTVYQASWTEVKIDEIYSGMVQAHVLAADERYVLFSVSTQPKPKMVVSNKFSSYGADYLALYEIGAGTVTELADLREADTAIAEAAICGDKVYFAASPIQNARTYRIGMIDLARPNELVTLASGIEVDNIFVSPNMEVADGRAVVFIPMDHSGRYGGVYAVDERGLTLIYQTNRTYDNTFHCNTDKFSIWEELDGTGTHTVGDLNGAVWHVPLEEDPVSFALGAHGLWTSQYHSESVSRTSYMAYVDRWGRKQVYDAWPLYRVRGDTKGILAVEQQGVVYLEADELGNCTKAVLSWDSEVPDNAGSYFAKNIAPRTYAVQWYKHEKSFFILTF